MGDLQRAEASLDHGARSATLLASTVLISTALAVSASAQSSPKVGDPPEAKDVRDAAKAFMASLADKDVSAAKKLFAGTDEDFKLVETMHDLYHAGQKLRDVGGGAAPGLHPQAERLEPFQQQPCIERR